MEDDAPYAQRPNSLKRLRACRSCKLIKTYEQFLSVPCENCPFTHPPNDKPGSRAEYVDSNTTDDFVGTVAMMRPDASWVARWLRMHSVGEGGGLIAHKPGVYAIRLPAVEMEEAMEAAGREAGAGGLDEEDEYEEEEEEEGEEEGGGGEEDEDMAHDGGRRGGAGAGGGGSDSALPSPTAAAPIGGGGRALPDRSDPSIVEAAVADATVEPDDE